jgi:tetratricopeptide (TPR) repeat protein
MHSENLELYSESTPVRGQETLRAFEQIRGFIVKSIAPRDGALGPVCVVAFKAEEDFAHFHQPKVTAISYAISGTDRDYVVMGVPEANAMDSATRAYSDLLIRQLGLNLPPWLDEGLHSFSATFSERSGEVVAGDMSPERRRTLYSETFGSLSPVLSAPANSKTDLNERFVLVHMLLLSSDYAPKFKNLVAALQSGTSSQAALESVYGKPLAAIEKDLKAYANSTAFVGTTISTGSKVLATNLGEPASAFDVNLALAGITNQPGRERDAEAWFERLAGMSPERPEPWAGLGFIAMRRGQPEVAEKNFEKAISLGSRDSAVLWAASRSARRDVNKDTEDSVRKLLEKEPTRADLRVRLAAVALDQRRPAIAYNLLEPVKDVPSDLTSRFLAELAYAQLSTGEKSAAKVTLARLEDRSSSASDKAEISRLKDFLAGPTHMTLGTKAPAAPNTDQLAAEAQRLAKEKELADAHEKQVADAREKELAAAREKEAAEVIDKAAADARLKAEARAKEKAEADQRAQALEEARVKAATEAREKALADAQEKKDAKAKEKADREAQAQALADARQKAAAEAREKAAAEAQEKQEAKQEAKAREKAEADAREKAIQDAHLKVAQAAQEAREKAAAEAREKAEADARQKAETEARLKVEAKAKADADAKAKADADARQKASEATVLAKAAKEARESADAAAQPQQASNLVPDSAAAARTFPSMMTGQFVELGCGDQIKVVVQTEQGKKNFRILNPANVIVSGKSGGTVDLNCGPQIPMNVRIQYGPGETGYDGQVEAIYFE